MTSSNYVIEARNLTKSYGKTQVLQGIDLQVERGSMVALLGPNGAGKTTTVRILSTLLGFDGGTVLVDGHDVRTQADKVRAVIGLTGQAAAVDELLTGRETLVMMGQLYRLTAASAKLRAQELYESDHWKNTIAPRIPEMMGRERMKVSRMIPTPRSNMR